MAIPRFLERFDLLDIGKGEETCGAKIHERHLTLSFQNLLDR